MAEYRGSYEAVALQVEGDLVRLSALLVRSSPERSQNKGPADKFQPEPAFNITLPKEEYKRLGLVTLGTTFDVTLIPHPTTEPIARHDEAIGRDIAGIDDTISGAVRVKVTYSDGRVVWRGVVAKSTAKGMVSGTRKEDPGAKIEFLDPSTHSPDDVSE